MMNTLYNSYIYRRFLYMQDVEKKGGKPRSIRINITCPHSVALLAAFVEDRDTKGGGEYAIVDVCPTSMEVSCVGAQHLRSFIFDLLNFFRNSGYNETSMLEILGISYEMRGITSEDTLHEIYS